MFPRDPLSSYPDDIFTIEYKAIRDLLLSKKIAVREVESGSYKNIHFNKGVSLEDDCRFSKTNRVCTMGAFSYSHSELGHGVSVGRYCSIGSGMKILGADHFPDWISTSPRFYEADYHSEDFTYTDLLRTPRKIEIGHDVWIGANVTLKRNVKIGNGAIIASGAMVTKDVLPFQIVGGVPAKEIKKRFPSELVSRIVKVSWWDYHTHTFKGLDASSPEFFISDLEKMVEAGLEKYSPSKITEKQLRDISSDARSKL